MKTHLNKAALLDSNAFTVALVSLFVPFLSVRYINVKVFIFISIILETRCLFSTCLLSAVWWSGTTTFFGMFV